MPQSKLLNIGMDDKNKEVSGIKKVISLFVKKWLSGEVKLASL